MGRIATPEFQGDEDTGTEVLRGDVEEVIFRSEDGDFAVLRVRDAASGRSRTAIGPLKELHPGEMVRLEGAWHQDPAHGLQFRVHNIVALLPDTLEGLERYLASGAVSGIGPNLAHRLVTAFGTELWQVLEGAEDRLCALPGIGPERARNLLEGWKAGRAQREALIFLSECGVSRTMALRIVRKYGKDTIVRVRKNPFALADDIAGIGFHRADALAANLGLEKDSEERARAAVHYFLTRAVDEGHVYLPLRRILEFAEPLGLSPANILRAVTRLEADGAVVTETVADGEDPPERALFLKALHRAECGAAARTKALLSLPRSPVPWRSEKDLEAIEARLGIQLGARQKEAVLAAQTAPLLVVSGGPGTGKTTLVRAILELFALWGTRVLLAAPTGRAAKRLQEATGCEARTLHRWLEAQPPAMHYKRNAQKPLETDVVLVDEVSMVDLPLFDALLAALPPQGRLILVGDVHQLPPVGPGNVLQAIIKTPGVALVMLEEVFRQAKGSMIALNAQRIQLGRRPVMARGASAGDADFFFLEELDPEKAAALVVDLVHRRLPAHYGLDPRKDIQVLAPSHKGIAGVAALNEGLQEVLNPHADALPEKRQGLRIGDKVLQGRNDYDKDLFNGDQGRVVGIESKSVTVEFDGRWVKLTRGEARALELAYAMTVHKAQGSEFPAVVFPVLECHAAMLRRNLLYTAITRASRLVVLVGSVSALERAIAREGGDRRYSRLSARLE